MRNACVPSRGSGSMPPKENFEFTSSQIASDTIWDKMPKQHFDNTYLCSVTCIANIITILNFKISGVGGEFQAPLCMKPCM